MKKKRLFTRRFATLALLLLSLSASAYDFMVDGLAYNILDDGTVEVTSTVDINVVSIFANMDENIGPGPVYQIDGCYYLIPGCPLFLDIEVEELPEDINYPNATPNVVISEQVSYLGKNYTVTGISDYAFAFSKITSVQIPSTIQVVGSAAFQDCTNLNAVYINDLDAWCRIRFEGGRTYTVSFYQNSYTISSSSGNPTYYARHLYLNGLEVTSVVVPDDITQLNYTFQNCENLNHVVLPANFTSIGNYSFKGTAINTIDIPNSVNIIGAYAFADCKNLPDSMSMPRNLCYIGDYAFAGSSLKKIVLDDSVKGIGRCAFDCGMTDLYSLDENPKFSIVESVRYGYYCIAEAYTIFGDFEYAEISIDTEGIQRIDIDCVLHLKYGVHFETDYYLDVRMPIVYDPPTPITSLTLNPSSLDMHPGDAVDILAECIPAKFIKRDLVWTSNNPSVVSISNGQELTARLVANTVGTAVVTATTTDGTDITAMCVVNVNDWTTTSITLNSTEESLTVGEQFQLTVTEHPSEATTTDVTWTTTDDAVASVSAAGLVQALSPGEATITATKPDGLSAQCHITVLRPQTESISLNESEMTLRKGQQHQLTVTFTPKYSYSDVRWTTSNSEVATVDDTGMVTATGEGIAAVIAITTDGSNLSGSCLVTVADVVVGDINDDGNIDIDDLNILINILLELNNDQEAVAFSDVNDSGNVDVDDLNWLINAILGINTAETATYSVGGVSFKMIPVAGGTFTMGATAEQGSDAASIEKPAHQVTLSNFSIAETEVTQSLWQAVMGSNPSGFTSDGQLPVECVSYEDCQAFITKLNQLTGQTFRLPTEAEWEFAARGGKKSKGTKYAGSSDIEAVGWCSSNAGEATHPVAKKAANELGLYDMSGNVWEWCSDWYGAYTADDQTNPTGPESGTMHVCRGGGWHSEASSCRTTSRTYNVPTKATNRIGLRLAM